MIGTSLSHFKITAKLGEGGMGEVYRAEDSKLGREVAIKVLPEAVANDPERLARFEREAKVVASLNHPNIAAIYQVEEADGVHFLVMELVEGEDLRERLERGAVATEDALPVASQMAQALEAAHEKGVIHRDLKPANVRITADGQVKVLDFGLAKALDPTAGTETGRFNSEGGVGPAPAALSLSPTLTQQMTSAGIILGTAAYMSPEQAKGETVDKRADIWSFGLVVFEMLTGRKLFAADSVAETLAGVIKTEIDFSRLPSDLSSEIDRLLRRCLERDAKNRLHDIADARIVIEDVLSGRVEEAPSTRDDVSSPATRWKNLLPYALGALGLAFGLLSIWRPWAPSIEPQPTDSPVQFAIQAPDDTLMISGLDLSPDGKRIALVARGAEGHQELWVRSLDSLEAERVTGTTGARYPFWAPDSRRIGFFAEGHLKVTDLIGSTPQALTTVGAFTFERGATWGAEDVIVFAPTFTGGMSRISASGGDPGVATEIPPGNEFGTHRFPTFLPDGRHFVFYASGGSGTEPGFLMMGNLESAEAKKIGPSNSRAVFADPDFLLYVRGETLVAHRIDLESLEFVGEPKVLGISLAGSISVSGHRSLAEANDILVYRNDTRSDTRVVWTDREGREQGQVGGSRKAWHYSPRLSPDGRFVVAGTCVPLAPHCDLWIHDLDRNIASPFQAGEGDEQLPAWSPTGDRIAYESIRSGGEYLVLVGSFENPDQKRVVYKSRTNPVVEFWLLDGQSIAFTEPDESGETAMWLLSLQEGSEPVPLFPGPGSQGSASLSPDGKWVAYMSDETLRPEVYVKRLDGQGPAQRVSSGGGGQPLWRRDGRELFYVNLVGGIVAVPVIPGDPPQFGAEEVLFNARLEESVDRQYDATPDGQRFVLNRQSIVGAAPIVVTTDWQRLLKN